MASTLERVACRGYTGIRYCDYRKVEGRWAGTPEGWLLLRDRNLPIAAARSTHSTYRQKETTMHVQQMISTHPHVRGNTNDILIHCVEACFDCEQACIACSDACLGEDAVQELTQCIRLNLDCADACRAAGALGSRRTGSNEMTLRTMLEACALACRTCGDECEKHAQQHEHCKICAEACRQCEHLCLDAARTIAPGRQ